MQHLTQTPAFTYACFVLTAACQVATAALAIRLHGIAERLRAELRHAREAVATAEARAEQRAGRMLRWLNSLAPTIREMQASDAKTVQIPADRRLTAPAVPTPLRRHVG